MYQQHTIVPGSIRPDGNQVCIDVRIGFPRGVPFTLIDGIEVTLDGRHHPPAEVGFELRGHRWTWPELVDVTDHRWEFGEVATLRIPGPLRPAPVHHVTVTQHLRVSPTGEVAHTTGSRTTWSAAHHENGSS